MSSAGSIDGGTHDRGNRGHATLKGFAQERSDPWSPAQTVSVGAGGDEHPIGDSSEHRQAIDADRAMSDDRFPVVVGDRESEEFPGS